MTYINSCKLLLKFDDTNLNESISTTSMVPVGNLSIDILPGGLGFMMKQDQYLQQEDFSGNGFVLDVKSQMIMGFWLYPVNPGTVVNPDTNEAESIQMPLIDLLPYDGHEDAIISIKEYTSGNEKNYLMVEMSNTSDPSNEGPYRVSTSKYTAGLWHYFWIVYNGSKRRLDIYIDGTLQLASVGSGRIPNTRYGEIPCIVKSVIADLYINRSVAGYAYNIAGNYGYIDDVIILNTKENAEKFLQRVINYSVDYVIDEDYVNIIKDSYGIMYNDPSTIRVNSLIDDMSFIFLARNDGKILRGSPLFWEVRKIFSDSREEKLYKETIVGGEDSDAASTTDNNGNPTGFLKVKKSMLRL